MSVEQCQVIHLLLRNKCFFERHLTHLLGYFDTAIVSIKELQEGGRDANGLIAGIDQAGILI